MDPTQTIFFNGQMFEQVLIDAYHTNSQRCHNITICCMMIWFYWLQHSIYIFRHNKRFRTTITEFVLERTSATIGFVIIVFYNSVRMRFCCCKKDQVCQSILVLIILIESIKNNHTKIFMCQYQFLRKRNF